MIIEIYPANPDNDFKLLLMPDGCNKSITISLVHDTDKTKTVVCSVPRDELLQAVRITCEGY